MKGLVFLGTFVLFVLGNGYVFYHLYPIVSTIPIILVPLYWTVVCLLLTAIFVFFLLGRQLPVPLASVFYKIGTGWLMLSIYAFLSVLVIDLVCRVNRVLSIVPDFTPLTQALVSLIAITIFALLGFIGYRRKRRIKLDLNLGVKTKYRVVFISDLHLGYAIGRNELKHWVKLINKEKPDLVLIGGDLIDYNLQPIVYYQMGELLQAIESKYGVYACLGNHDYMAGARASVKFMNDNGIQVLEDSLVKIDDLSLVLVGRDDKTNRHRKSLSSIVGKKVMGYTYLLLDHQPYVLEQAEQAKIDLQLSGHTHRGQVWPISWITDRLFETAHGYLQKGKTHYYVSSGLGIWGGRYRIGTQSEYVVIDIT
ncbi:metallophosphoesterase [Myroides pelagicus]|uniref:Metallophosphoesterase n=1 Tax=Myroides pelagicus TaxID=270914 RepID=A0A7K1GNA0_9FLAO|nr:metallophosphoesterase [Myroides pelagicus]MTH29863.1 metallophosphoesterase [Myroides pelagicus]